MEVREDAKSAIASGLASVTGAIQQAMRGPDEPTIGSECVKASGLDTKRQIERAAQRRPQ
jgi:hypothetical protein